MPKARILNRTGGGGGVGCLEFYNPSVILRGRKEYKEYFVSASWSWAVVSLLLRSSFLYMPHIRVCYLMSFACPRNTPPLGWLFLSAVLLLLYLYKIVVPLFPFSALFL